ncbi:MAG: mercuric transporter MerT family protein [Lysobacter sp.]
MRTNPAKSSMPAILGASLAAIGASICCVVPLVLVLLGISGAWIGNLTALDTWRPWFTGATLLLLGLAFWSLYGPTSQCRADGACIDPRTLKRRRRWLWLAAFVIAMLLLFPYYVVWFF